MAGGQWEVVGKTKHKNDSKSNGAKEKNKSGAEKPKLELSGPIERCPTMYDAFLEKDRKQCAILKNEPKETPTKVKEASTQQKKKKSDKKIVHPVSKSASTENIFLTITEDSLRKNLHTAKARFPDSPLIWLKDLCSYINSSLDVAVKDPVFSSQPDGYPCSMINKGAYNVLANAVKNCPPVTLQIFFDATLQALIQDTIKGLHTLGYYLVLQCLAKEMSSVIKSSLAKCVDHCNTYKNRQDVCLSILFVCGQAGSKNVETGFQIWNLLMFPVVTTKSCSSYAVSYLEKLLKSENCLKVDKGFIGVKELFPILDFVFSNDLPTSFQKRLLPLYPRLKYMSYGVESKTVLRNFFPSYLRRLESRCPTPLKIEILSSIKQCLLEDSHCFSVWRQLYMKHLIQSRLLIAELNDEWDDLPSGFPKKLLRETLETFQVTNEQLIAQGKSDDVESCIPIIDELLFKMNSQKFPWHWILLGFFSLISSLLAYDIYEHGSFKASVTGRFLTDSGMMDIINQGMSRVQVYSQKGMKWLNKNVPIYTNYIFGILNPYLESFWKKAFSLCKYCWKNMGFIKTWGRDYILPMLLMMNDKVPEYSTKLMAVAENSSNILFELISSAVHALGGHGNIIENLHLEEIQKFFYSALETSQRYIFFTYEWVQAHISNVISRFSQN